MRAGNLFILFINLAGFAANAQFKTTRLMIFSKEVNDSFEIQLTIPADYSPQKKYDLLIYGDANLISGKELRKQVTTSSKPNQKGNYIFAGIGYKHGDHRLRNRDFILPRTWHGQLISSTKRGRCPQFYSFIVHELIPLLESSYSLTGKRSILGHSLGGLFVFYCLFQNEAVFTGYFALSPALWVNHSGIYFFNKIERAMKIRSNLYFSAGSKEDFNLIQSSSKKMKRFLEQQHYDSLEFKYEVHPGKGHFSQVAQSIRYVLDHLH